jgi:hypothetical protein
MRPKFFRRYKWAFKAEYDQPSRMPVAAQPELHLFIRTCGEMLRSIESEIVTSSMIEGGWNASCEPFTLPADCAALAKSIAEGMVERNETGAWAGAWATHRVKVN